MGTHKPIELNNSHISKEEIEIRKENEERLKGNSDLIYEIPKQLKTKKEKELYRFIVDELKASNILSNVDVFIILQIVEAVIQMQEASKHVKKYGQIICKVDGSFQKNPSTNIYKDYYSIFYQSCNQIGLSPTARAKLATLNIAQQDNDNDELLKILKG